MTPEELEGSVTDAKTGVISKGGKPIGVLVDGKSVVGFPTPSRKNEFYSQTMVDWKWPNMRFQIISRVTFIPMNWINPKENMSWFPPFVYQLSSILVRVMPSGCMKFRIAIPSGCILTMLLNGDSRPVIWLVEYRYRLFCR